MEYNANAAMPDDQLIQYFVNNDVAAMETLVYLNKDKIYRSIFSVVQDKQQADEIFQQVFTRIIDLMMAGKMVEEGKFLPWAMRLANDICIEQLRKINYAATLKTKSDIKYQITRHSSAGQQQGVANNNRHDEIRSMIDMLPEKEREIMVLRHYANLSFKEIAEIMKCNISTALGQMRYALANLHRIIKEKQVTYNI